MAAGVGSCSGASALLLLLLLTTLAAADVSSDGAALLAFLTNLPHSPRLNWSSSTSPCTWHGVSCNPNVTAVTALRLPAADLAGPVPPNTLSRLSSLRVLSLHSNALSGPIPQLSNLTLLRSLYLQNNLLSGQLSATIAHLSRLTRLDVSNNNLTGVVPFSLNNLTALTGLFLQHNSFSGSLPSISIPSLTEFNISYNGLNGSVPAALQRYPVSSFAGNVNLCGGPLPPCKPFFPPVPAPAGTGTTLPSSAHRKRKLSAGLIAAIAAGVLLIVLLLLTVLWCACLRRPAAAAKPPTVKTETAVPRSGDSGLMMSSSSMSKEEAAKEGEKNRLTFVGKGGGYSFDLEDLLRASAEVLGKGTVGTSYKAVLEEGTTVVVKRLKEVAATRREFEQQMEALGRPEVQENPNVLALRAYYYSKDEKLLVFDFLAAGSLSALLHGSRGSGRTPLDWESRMRIALAAGRGLAHLHTSARIVHGNLKASNVLLRDSPDNATLSDYGLVPLFASLPRNSRAAGYRAPEVVETRKPTYKSDVYSLGVLLLELLTGKAPNQASIAGEEGIDLPRWVQSVVREEWTAEVFDVELMRYPNIEEEMVQLLQIAMACVSVMPDSRPDANVVVRMMEDIVRRAEQSEEGQPGSSDEPSKGGTPPAVHTP